MPFETPIENVRARVARLNEAYKHHAAIPVLRMALADPHVGRTAMVSSFGAESVVLLHMISVIDPTTPVLFIDTQMLFQETLDYQILVSKKLGLCDVRTLRARPDDVKRVDPFSRLHLADANSCCNLRKTDPLTQALGRFDAWITGRKRFQSDTREQLPLFEVDTDDRIKINPLAGWRREDLVEYIDNNNLPRHPLVAQGYPSLGCSPNVCTRKVGQNDDPRAGRWAGQNKTECGIHTSPKINNETEN